MEEQNTQKHLLTWLMLESNTHKKISKHKSFMCTVWAHCHANEVRVVTDAFTPEPHQLFAGKLLRQQSSDGFTVSTPYDSNKVLHHRPVLCVLWKQAEKCFVGYNSCVRCKKFDPRRIPTSHFIQKSRTGSTSKAQGYRNSFNGHPNLETYLQARLVLVQIIV